MTSGPVRRIAASTLRVAANFLGGRRKRERGACPFHFEGVVGVRCPLRPDIGVMTMVDQIPTIEDIRRVRYPAPISAYRRGFDDAAYERVYAPPYKPGSGEWREYGRGVEDAARSRRASRSRW